MDSRIGETAQRILVTTRRKFSEYTALGLEAVGSDRSRSGGDEESRDIEENRVTANLARNFERPVGVARFDLDAGVQPSSAGA